MLRHKKAHLVAYLLALAIVIAGISLYARVEMSLAQEPEAELPIVDYDAPEPVDKEKREKRRARGQKYKADRPIDPTIGEMTRTSTSHWFYGMTPLPTAHSEAVVVGEVTAANAYLTPDKSAVYSEYTVRVEEVLKTNDSAIVPNCTIDVQRPGGRVRLPSGQIQTYIVLGVGVPRVGRRYAFFLERREQDLQIITGYELRQNKVKPLDSVQMFQVYEGMGGQAFMDALRQAIISPQKPPQDEMLMGEDPPPPESEPGPSATACVAPTPGPCTQPPRLAPKHPFSNRTKNIKSLLTPRVFLKTN